MEGFVELDKFRVVVLDAMRQLLELRTAAEQYAAAPNDQNGERLVGEFQRFASYSNGIELNLGAIVKQANGTNEDGIEIVVAEAENGMLLK